MAWQGTATGQVTLSRSGRLVAGLVVTLASIAAIYALSPRAEAMPQVTAVEVLAGESELKMAEAGLYVLDYQPPYKPQITLEQAAAYLRDEAWAEALSGALVMVNTSPAGYSGAGFLRGTVGESLAWAIEVDTTGLIVPELFDPDHHTIAFIDADGGGLLGVFTH